MKQIIIKALKIILLLFILALLGLLVFGLILYLRWPWWVAIFVFLGLLGIFLGVLFIRKILLRKKEQQFVQQIIAQDQEYLKASPDTERAKLKDLQEQWSKAIKTLKKSRLKRLGNPLYVLPWYMIIGESGSGKTTAIMNSGLSSPFAEAIRASGISGTRNCDWWFFEQAIILDTAGRYAIPVEPGRDMEEWQRFLSLLAKYRKKEPINGVVVTVSAQKIISASPDELERDGIEIRKRIDELMRALSFKFPVYLMVTKCDLIRGMSTFCEDLPEEVLNQAMGVVNEDNLKDPDALVEEAVDSVSEKLRELRLILLEKEKSSKKKEEILLFPSEFERLKSGLKAFSKTAFKENPYQESPIFRGIYFSSAKQEGTPYSHFLHSLGLIEKEEVLPGTSKGLFLRDFFSRILPGDRQLFSPTTKGLKWQNITRNLGLASWILIWLAICGLISLSFVKNLWTLRDISALFSKPVAMTGQPFNDLATLVSFKDALVRVEDQNKNWWIPRFGLKESINLEEELKERFCTWFHDSFIKTSDEKIAIKLAQFNNKTPNELLASYLPYVIRRINLAGAYLDGKSFEELKDMPLPGIALGYISLSTIPKEELEKRFNELYLYYLKWNKDRDEISKEVSKLRSWLKHLFFKSGLHLRWILNWINQYSDINYITLEEFWGGVSEGETGITVAPAFTRKGHDLLVSFLNEIERALDDPLLISRQERTLKAWYAKKYQENWYEFVSNFSKGAFGLKTRDDWQQMALRMIEDKNPYFNLLKKMSYELEPIRNENESDWITLVFEIEAIRNLAKQQEGVQRVVGTVSKLTKKGRRLLSLIGSGASKKFQARSEARLRALKSFKEYKKALKSQSSVIISQKACYRVAKNIFSGEGINENVSLLRALNKVFEMRTLLGRTGSKEDVIWRIVQGPADFCWSYICLETACYLQELWNEEILSELQGANDWTSIKKLLLGKEGKVWHFVKGPAGPFIGWRPGKGYFAKEATGAQIPFKPGFFAFLNKSSVGKVQSRNSYEVFIKALPIDTNPDALIKPFETRLELQCSSASQILINQNYPVSKRFKWQPKACGDVVFKIGIGNLTLTKTYSGYEGFPKFLLDFRDGKHVFEPEDFPEHADALKRLNIKYIKVQYQINGGQPIFKLLEGLPQKVPEKIVTCWD